MNIYCIYLFNADDTILYFTGYSSTEITNTLQNDLDLVMKWMEGNRLILNQSKTKTMLFGKRQKLEKEGDLQIWIHDQILEQVSVFKYLGVLLDEKLSWKEHTEAVSKNVSKRLGLLSRIRKCLTLKASKCVYNAIIQPLLDYADTTWGDLSEGCGQELQRLQNRAARIILQCGSSRDTFHLLNWINLISIRKMHKCIMVFNV